MSLTNSQGFNDINSKVLRMIQHIALLCLPHLIDSIITTGKLPQEIDEYLLKENGKVPTSVIEEG